MLTHHRQERNKIISQFLVSVPTLLSSVFVNVIALYEDRNSLKKSKSMPYTLKPLDQTRPPPGSNPIRPAPLNPLEQ